MAGIAAMAVQEPHGSTRRGWADRLEDDVVGKLLRPGRGVGCVDGPGHDRQSQPAPDGGGDARQIVQIVGHESRSRGPKSQQVGQGPFMQAREHHFAARSVAALSLRRQGMAPNARCPMASKRRGVVCRDISRPIFICRGSNGLVAAALPSRTTVILAHGTNPTSFLVGEICSCATQLLHCSKRRQHRCCIVVMLNGEACDDLVKVPETAPVFHGQD